LVIGGDADPQTSGVVTGQTEPAPIVKQNRLALRTPATIVAVIPDVDRAPEHTLVFSQALDVMSEGVGTSDIFEDIVSNPLRAAFQGSGFVLSAGFLTWALRGASLLASMAASLPAWQGFDPLPVLAAKKRDKKKDEVDEDDNDNKSDDDWQEKRIQRLFNSAERVD
jgi:hypothetical protein